MSIKKQSRNLASFCCAVFATIAVIVSSGCREHSLTAGERRFMAWNTPFSAALQKDRDVQALLSGRLLLFEYAENTGAVSVGLGTGLTAHFNVKENPIKDAAEVGRLVRLHHLQHPTF
jgi:hypothetical protein